MVKTMLGEGGRDHPIEFVGGPPAFPAGARRPLVYGDLRSRLLAGMIDAAVVILLQLLLIGCGALILWLVMRHSIGSGLFWMAVVVSVVLPWLYFTLSEGSPRQATPGKRAMGLVVTNLIGNRLYWGQANARFWAKVISTASLFLGIAMTAVTTRRQALHDVIARTLVVEGAGRGSGRPGLADAIDDLLEDLLRFPGGWSW